MITGIHGLPFDQQNDDRYWQTKQILPNILRPLGSGIKNAAIINEGVYNINPIAGTNNFGGSDISLASGTNPTNYSIVNTSDIEDRLRAHAVPANNPLSAEFAQNLAPDAQLKPNSVEGDPMLNTFRTEESILRNAQSQVYDENLITAEGADETNESLIYGQLRSRLIQAHRSMASMDQHDIMRGMLMRNQSEAIRRRAAQRAGQVYNANNRREDLAAQYGNVGGPPGGFGGSGGGSGAGGGSGKGGGSGGGADGGSGGAVVRTAFAAGTHLNQPAFQARNGRIGVNKNSKIGGSVMEQVETIDNQNSAYRTNNLRYDYHTPEATIDATIATAIVRPASHQPEVQAPYSKKPVKSARTEPDMPPLPSSPSRGRSKALQKKSFPTGPGYGTVRGSMQIDQSTMRSYTAPNLPLSPQRRTQTTKEQLDDEITPTGGETQMGGGGGERYVSALDNMAQSDNSVMRQIAHENYGASDNYVYNTLSYFANMSDDQIGREADIALNNTQGIPTAISAVGDAINNFIPTISPPSNNKPTVDPSEVKLKQDNERLQKERDDSINEVENRGKEINTLLTEKNVLQQQIKDLELSLENIRKENSTEAHAKEREFQSQLHFLQKRDEDYDYELEYARREGRILRERVKGLEQSLQMGQQEYTGLAEFTSQLRSEYASSTRELTRFQELDAQHKSEIDALSAQLDSLSAQLEDAHGQREVDVHRINELHGELVRVSGLLEMKQDFVDPSRIRPILDDFERVSNELRIARNKPATEITVYRDTYVPSRYEGSGELPIGKRPRDEVDSTIKNSMDSTHMIAGVIPTGSLPTPISNMSATNQLSEANNLPNMLDQRERIVNETKAARDYSRKVIGGGAAPERYEEAVATEKREREQKAELRQLIARVGRLVEGGKRFGKNVQPYTQDDIIRLYIDEINDSVVSSKLAGCSTPEILGAVNSALEGSAITFHNLDITKRGIYATAGYSKGGMESKSKYGRVLGSGGKIQVQPLKK